MSQIGVRCVRGLIDLKEHERCMAQEPGPPCLISPTILNMMTTRDPERDGIKFSPSSLGNCHRRTTLAHNHEWFLDVKAAYAMIRGTIVHEGIAHQPPPDNTLGVVRELRMQTPTMVDGKEQTFYGKPDEIVLLRVEDGTLFVKLIDYKTKVSLPPSFNEPYKAHTYQTNSYAYLIEQFLPDWLNGITPGEASFITPGWTEHLYLVPDTWLPHIDKVVVDELSLVYMSMDDVRTFSSKGFLYAESKSGQQIELSPIQHFDRAFTVSKIREGIKRQIEAETMLAPPLEADRAYIMCGNCPVRTKCIETGLAEGYDMRLQERYE